MGQHWCHHQKITLYFPHINYFRKKQVKPSILLTDGAAKSTLAAVRTLAERGLRVHVAADTSLALAKWSRFATKRHRVPSAQKEPRLFAESIADLQRKEDFDVIIPVADYEISALLEYEDVWKPTGAKMALPSREAFSIAWDKCKTMKLATRLGVPCPETWYPDEQHIEQIRDIATYPLLIKPNISAGARGITLVETPEELVETYKSVIAKWGPAHLQEWIPDGGEQFKSDVILGASGEVLALFVCRKVRYYPVKGGSSTLIVSQKDEAIEQSVLKIVKELQWHGFADFDFIVDPRDGVAKLMECNPRFPESLVVNLFAGVDFAWIVYQLASQGAAQPITAYREGRYARFLVGDFMWFLSSQQRWKAKPSFFNFFGRDLTYYVERLDDPGPTLCYLIEAILTLISPRKLAYRFGRGFRRPRSAQPVA